MDSDGMLTFASAEQGFVYMKTFFSSAPEPVLEALRSRVLLETSSNRLQELSGYVPDFLAEKWEERKVDVACDIIRAVCDGDSGFLLGLKRSAGTNIVSSSEGSEFAAVLPLALERVREEKILQTGAVEGSSLHFYDGRIVPGKDVVFVFGSNPEGRHGAGSAKVAVESFGAVYGQGEGLQGNSYALPTKDLRVRENDGLRSILEKDIVANISRMYECARQNPDRQFKVAYMNAPDEVTLNGYNGSEMVSMFLAAGSVPENVQFSSVWKEEMERQLDGGAVVAVKSGESRVFVSYYGSRSIPSDAYRVCISTSVPKGYEVDSSFSLVYPSYRDMVGPHKDGLIVDEVYRRRYETLLERNKAAVLRGVESLKRAAAGRDVYLLCYCRPGVFCHRYLLQNFLLRNGVDCQENPEDRKMYVKGRIPESGSEVEHGQFDDKVDGDFRLERSEPLDDDVSFTSSRGGYSLRTQENANAAEVDFTLAFAVDFTTGGEVCTAKAAGDSLVRIPTQVRDGHLDLSRDAVDRAVDVLRREIPAEYFGGESCGLNIAGNGLVTFAQYGVRQFEVDLFVASVLKEASDNGLKVSSLRSGGQTGADEAAYVASRILGVPLIVHAPADWSYRVPSNNVSRGVDIRDGERFVGRFEVKDCNRYRDAVDRILFQERNVVKNDVKQIKL